MSLFKKNGENELKKIMKRFFDSYIENEKSQDKKSLEDWLEDTLRNELPKKSKEEIKKYCKEIFEGIKSYKEKKEEVQKYRQKGLSAQDYIAKKIQEANIKTEELEFISKNLSEYNEILIYEADKLNKVIPYDDEDKSNDNGLEKSFSSLKVKNTNEYIDNISNEINRANENLMNTILTKSGEVSKNPNLDGFIFEEYQANTFNIDAAVKENNNVRAQVLKPSENQTFRKNSVDVVVRDSNNKIISKYQAKAGKNEISTDNLFKKGDYRGQQKLVPEGHHIKNAKDKISYDNVTSTSITKEKIKEMQRKVQNNDIENIKHKFSDVNNKILAGQISKQVITSSTMSIGIGAGLSIAGKVFKGEYVEPEEVIVDGLKAGGETGVSVATAGALKVAVENQVFSPIITKFLSSNNVIGTVAMSIIDIISNIIAVGSGEKTFSEGISGIIVSLASSYGAILGGVIAGTIVAGITVGMIATIGSVIAGVAVVVATVVGAYIGSNLLGALAKGVTKIAKPILQGATNIVKCGVEVVKNVASGIWNGVKSVVSTAWEGVKSVGSAIGGFFGGLFGW